MKWTQFGFVSFATGVVLSCVPGAQAASSLSNSLTGFTGNSTVPVTQAAVGAAGLNFYSTAGELTAVNDNGTPDDPGDDFVEVVGNDTVVFDASGAHFGTLFSGDGGRNYMRTNESDYASVKFTAEITFEAGDDQAVFIGLGAGDRALFGTPDWSTQFSSASFWVEINNDKFARFRTYNDQPNQFVGDSTVPGLSAGTHRFRMTFNPANRQLLGEIDTNYAGGPFVPDATMSNFPIVTTPLYEDVLGWLTEPSRYFFGGDDGAVFRDFSVTVVPEPASIVLLGFVALMTFGFRSSRIR